MILIKRMAVGLLAGLTVGVTSAKAQYAQPQWGTGVWGGQQPCPYPMQVGNGAQNYVDEYRELQGNLSEEKGKLSDLKAKHAEIKDLVEEAEAVVNGTINQKYADFIIEHASNQRRCSEYQRTGRVAPAPAPEPVSERPAPPPSTALPNNPPASADPGAVEGETKEQRRLRLLEEAKKRKANAKEANGQAMITQSRGIASDVGGEEGDGANDELIPITGFTDQQWFSNCISRSKGAVNSRVCTTRPFNVVRKRTASDSECKRALLHLTNGYEDLQKLETQIASAERRITRLEDQLGDPDRLRRRSRSQTESGFCAMCEEYARANRERAQWGSLVTAGVGALLHYSERQDNKAAQRMYAQYDSDNGHRTTPYFVPSSGVGGMLMAGGLAGYISGGTGAGTFGCATGVNGTGNINGPMGIAGPYGQGPGLYPPIYGQNTGAFGYPPHILGPQQGGQMYMPGQGPWGPNGPYALNGNQGPVLVAPGSPYGNGYNNGAVPYGAVIGVDAYGNRIYSQGGVPGMPPGPGMPGYQPGMPMPYGGYNPYGYTNNGQGYSTGPYAYQPGPVQPYPYQQGGSPYGYNGGPGIPIGSIPTGAASGVTSDLLRLESFNLQNRAAAVGAMGPGYNPGYNFGYNAGSTGYYAPNPYAMPSSGYLSGSITIGGSYNSNQPNYNYNTNSGGTNSVIVPGASR